MGRGSEQIFFQRKRHPYGHQVHEKMLNIANHQGNANQNHNEIALHMLGYLLSKRQEVKYWQECRERQPLCTDGGGVNL